MPSRRRSGSEAVAGDAPPAASGVYRAVVRPTHAQQVRRIASCPALFDGANVVHAVGDIAAQAPIRLDVLAERIREQLRAPRQPPCLRAVERIVHAAGLLALFAGVLAAASADFSWIGASGLEAQPKR